MKFAMQDSRVFTDYLPNCQLNANLQKKYGSTDIHAFRFYLQQNAEKVMKDMQPLDEGCKTCPICDTSLSYKPSGNII